MTQVSVPIAASDNAPLLDSLYAGLSGREQPESVAVAVVPLIRDRLTPAERASFNRGLRVRLARSYGRFGSGHTYADADLFADPADGFEGYDVSSMPTTFESAASLNRQARVLSLISGFTRAGGALFPDFDRSPAALDQLLAYARAQIGLQARQADFKRDRLNRAARAAHGYEISRRRYDKLFRAIVHLEALRAERAQTADLVRLARFAKTAFAAELVRERFGRDGASAAFVAYLCANLGRRSLFTNGRQAGAFDERANALFAALGRSSNTDWFAIAHVFPRADVLDRLSVEERAHLLERSLAVLSETAARLEAAALSGDIDTATMIVTRGNDSSTWNALAGAWNRARDFWIALIYSLGQERLFEAFLPGKVLRLMAADVAAWHRQTAGNLHDDTPIWAALPRPWAVMAGRARCGRAEIEAACAAVGVESRRTGWSAARPRMYVEPTRPTPETVHGVIVGHPALAAFLRRIDAFGGHGHPLRWERATEAEAAGAGASPLPAFGRPFVSPSLESDPFTAGSAEDD
jgi:hypothetical protein